MLCCLPLLLDLKHPRWLQTLVLDLLYSSLASFTRVFAEALPQPSVMPIDVNFQLTSVPGAHVQLTKVSMGYICREKIFSATNIGGSEDL